LDPRLRGDERGKIGVAFFTYLLASAPYGTLYCGHTDSLTTRVWKHREKTYSGFTAKYGVMRLVWFEAYDTRDGAFRRERQIKKWNRAWKIRLIETENSTWSNLYDQLIGPQWTGQLLIGEIAPVARSNCNSR
jgi:putative endonuclease